MEETILLPNQQIQIGKDEMLIVILEDLIYLCMIH